MCNKLLGAICNICLVVTEIFILRKTKEELRNCFKNLKVISFQRTNFCKILSYFVRLGMYLWF